MENRMTDTNEKDYMYKGFEVSTINEKAQRVLNNIINKTKSNDTEIIETPKTIEETEDSRYDSRELSWIKFNERVLSLAENVDTPIIEKLKYLSICASNLDEFMMVRVASLINEINKGDTTVNIANIDPHRELSLVNKKIKTFNIKMQNTYKNIVNEFDAKGIKFVKPDKLTKKGKKYIEEYFENRIYYSLTPIVFDESRPFPVIPNKSLNIGVLIEDANYNYNMIGTLQIPQVTERFVEIKDKNIPEGETWLISIEDIILMNLNKIFINKNIISSCVYRILRNSDISVNTSSNKFLADEMVETLKERELGTPMKLEITDCKKELLKVIQKTHNLSKKNVFVIREGETLDMSSIAKFDLKHVETELLKYKKFSSRMGEDLFGELDIFEALDKRDVILHHPYDTYQHVVDFITQASENPNVVAIKQTLYRVSDNSPIINALIKAAKKGKQVTCLLEIKARFNEGDNINWAEKLEKVGCHVIYGIDDLKTHCKMTLVVKRGKKNNLNTYCHLGTGNYNDVTSKVYTDISYFTTNNGICNDVAKLFNTLTGFSEPRLKHVVSAPYHLRNELMSLIDNEIKFAKEGKEAIIKAKCNALIDKGIIDKLYEASEAGVKIELIVRGACSLKTNRTYSKNITVKSVVGRFLEHSRIYYFHNNKHTTFISSADLMERNLDKRFEIMIPIIHKTNIIKVNNILNTFINDNTCFKLEGTEYIKLTGDEVTMSQKLFMEESNNVNKYKNVNKVFIRAKK